MGEGFVGMPYPDAEEGLIKPLADVIRNSGGVIRTGNPVVEVVVEDNTAKGVVFRRADGIQKKLFSERVIVNAIYEDIPAMFRELPPEVESAIGNLKDWWHLSLMTYTGLSRKITDIASNMLIQDPKTGSNLGIILMQSNIPFLSWTAPSGKQTIKMTTPLNYTREEAQKLTATDLEAHYALMNDIQEEVLPGFKKATEKQIRTRSQPSWHHQFAPSPRIPQRSSTVRNLYFIGDSTEPQYGSGCEGAASTGMLCAKGILGIES